MKRQSKKYARPRKPFDKVRIEEEDVLVEKYGLKNKKEIRKAEAAVSRIRGLAKKLITAHDERKNAFLNRLLTRGFIVDKIADVLALDKEAILKRRLQTIVHTKGLTNTAKQARQFITHKHVSIGERIVNIPSYSVSIEEEKTIQLHVVLPVNTKEKEKNEDALEEENEIAGEIEPLALEGALEQ
ncbi:MAG: 30S ribosomal protein S4 [Nanoarchaeota archaeon]